MVIAVYISLLVLVVLSQWISVYAVKISIRVIARDIYEVLSDDRKRSLNYHDQLSKYTYSEIANLYLKINGLEETIQILRDELRFFIEKDQEK